MKTQGEAQGFPMTPVAQMDDKGTSAAGYSQAYLATRRQLVTSQGVSHLQAPAPAAQGYSKSCASIARGTCEGELGSTKVSVLLVCGDETLLGEVWRGIRVRIDGRGIGLWIGLWIGRGGRGISGGP